MNRLSKGTQLHTVAKEWDVYFDMAMVMLEEIMKNNACGRRTVMIVPVGPTDQYPILARLVNQLRISLKNVWFFNMDEYLLSPTEAISSAHPLSFARRMNESFYSLVDQALIMPPAQRLFPQIGKEQDYDALLESLGGADLCLGGLGINGHIAFNEPAEAGDPMTATAFGMLPTRVLPISRETQTINAYGYQRGDLRGMPTWCITVGMKQILQAKKIYIAINRDWQHGILKHALFDAPSAQLPASLLQNHPSVTFCLYEAVARDLPEG